MKYIYTIIILFLLGCEQKTLPKVMVDVKQPRPAIQETVYHIQTKISEIESITLEQLDEEMLSRQVLLAGVQSVLDTFIKEKLPFDEPRVEVGQEDGKLREFWQVSWSKGRGRFGYRGEWYYVRSSEGNAIPPQVCADFIVDTFDRLGGSWWVDNKRIDSPSSFTNFIKSYNLYHRRVSDLIQVMKVNPQYFEIIYSKKREGVRLKDYNQLHNLFNDLDIVLGDIVFINGPTPWDKSHEHWHSFFIYKLDNERKDWEVVGNASMSAKRWLISEAKRTPYRKVWYIFRPTDLFLDTVTKKEQLIKNEQNIEQMETIR